jgi:cholesterol transport system auxiliary component
MKGSAVLAFAVLVLAGCSAGQQVTPKVSYYDLGPAAAAPNNRTVASLRSIDVFVPSWLDTSALQYRLAYQGSQRRQNYAESRWVASPAELVGNTLKKRMFSGEAAGACRLRVDLDEFAHVFDTADASRAVIEARVQLLAPGGELLARHSFSLSRPAASADARGAVAAFSGAVADLSTALHDWLGGLDREARPGLNTAQRCRGT